MPLELLLLVHAVDLLADGTRGRRRQVRLNVELQLADLVVLRKGHDASVRTFEMRSICAYREFLPADGTMEFFGRHRPPVVCQRERGHRWGRRLSVGSFLRDLLRPFDLHRSGGGGGDGGGITSGGRGPNL